MQYELLRILEAEVRESEQFQIEGLYDATRHEQEEEQKQDALSRTQTCLRRGDMETAVATLRAAREIWPRDDFGPRDSTCIDELRSLKDIYLRPLIPFAEVCEFMLDEEELGEEVEIPVRKIEGEFDLFTYSLKFCHQRIMKTFSYLLTQYSFNSDFTNHALVKMLHRICYQCKKFPLIYQISLFSVFQFILEESNSSRYQELRRFVVHVLNNFFSAAKQNPCLFAEILFWKSQEECVDIELGYGTVATMRESKVTRRTWSEEETARLISLWLQYKGCEGVLGEIAAEITNKAELQIKKKLLSLGLAEKTDFVKAKKSKRIGWSGEEDERLRELYAVYGEQEDHVQAIASHFTSKNEREVSTRMKGLGLDTANNGSPVMSGISKTKRIRKKKLNNDTVSESKRNRVKSQLSLTRAISLYQTIRNDDKLIPCLEWLGKSLRREAVDREIDEEWEGIPLVPNNLELGKALESDSFHHLMRALSLTEPDTGQMFWRIPAEMTPADLISCADLLSDKPLETPDSDSACSSPENDNSVASEMSDSGSESSQLSADEPTEDIVKVKRFALAKLVEKRRSSAMSESKSKETVSDSDLSDLQAENKIDSLDHIIVPSPPLSKMKPSVKRLYNSDSETETREFENSSQPLHSRLQRLRADLSEDSDLEPDHFPSGEEFGDNTGRAGQVGRVKRARLDSEDSAEELSSPRVVKNNLKKVRYIQESDSDHD